MAKRIIDSTKKLLFQKYRKEFLHIVLKENFARLVVIAPLVLFVEILIYNFISLDFPKEPVLYFIISNLVLVPLIFYFHEKDNVNGIFPQAVMVLYILSIFYLGMGLSLMQLGKESLYIFVMATFAVMSFLYIQPKKSLALMIFSAVLFAISVPYFTPDTNLAGILRTNIFVLNFFAWILSCMVFGMKYTTFLDNESLLDKNNQLKALSILDQMTMMFNNEHSYKQIEEAIYRAQTSGSLLSIVLIDIDKFKLVNDTHGHTVGDEVIKKLADIIKKNVRNTDKAGRYGGEEFIILMEKTSLDEAENLVKRLQKAVWSDVWPKDLNITFSAGISQYESGSATEFVNTADEKLYQAKQSGRNRYVK